MIPGPLLFARYAYAPNALGYCGGEDPQALLEYGAAGVSDGGLRRLAESFDGAWPYLQLIAASNRIRDPLDRRVVEAYWVGNALLDRIDPSVFANLLVDRFAPRLARDPASLVAPVLAGAVPHHSFHVLAVYPWVGLLRAGYEVEPLRVLESCRIRWGTVRDIVGEHALVESSPLHWDGRRLSLGLARLEPAVVSLDRRGFVDALRPGEVVSLHWNWVCDRLDVRSATSLKRRTEATLRAVNVAAIPAAAVAFG